MQPGAKFNITKSQWEQMENAREHHQAREYAWLVTSRLVSKRVWIECCKLRARETTTGMREIVTSQLVFKLESISPLDQVSLNQIQSNHNS